METEMPLKVRVPAGKEPVYPIGFAGKKPSGSRILTGWQKTLIGWRIRAVIMGVIARHSTNPARWFRIAKALDKNRRRFSGESRVKKVVALNGRFHWDMYIPGSPSRAFTHYIASEVRRYVQPDSDRALNTVFFAITKKCSLRCEHCFEWDNLNGKEALSGQDIRQIVRNLQDRGVTQIFFSGGEPMLRFDDLAEALIASEKKTEFWLQTSGFKLTEERARALKSAGLTGVAVSLDHFDPEKHNAFRGMKTSFEWAEKAIANANAAHLITALSICATREFTSEENLMTYADLAKRWNVSFIQILEPRAVGHYKGKDVGLGPEQVRLLDNFYLKMNFDKSGQGYPLVNYHAQHQRRVGCVGAGNRLLYVDTDGDLHACPFCHSKSGSALSSDLDSSFEKLRGSGCHIYESSSF